jgi:F-type H+-transporting ATPase subunit delta
MSHLTTVARPYARAAFEFAAERKTISKWSEMVSFAALVAADLTMSKIIKSDKTPKKMADLFINVCGEQLNKEGKNLIKLLAESQHLIVLPQVCELFTILEKKYKKEVDVSVISAFKLTGKQKKELSKSLEKRLDRKVNFSYGIDKKVITGMIITAGDLVIDSTVKNQLSHLSRSLQS